MEAKKEKTEGNGSCGSPSLVRGVLLLQEKWVLLIVNQLLKGPVGFNELSRKAEGVNVTTLSQRLALLEQAGLVIKTIHSTMPPRTSYELTEAGRALEPVLEAIETWSEKYLSTDAPTLPCPEEGCTNAG
ncbi:MAG TPA: helix-turn-helix domain-containing protein [Chthonomonadaceae bacterium]|nr:helix-turn-helix domain-containing protein [Chthonomonadaceae bacterium]